MMNDCYILVVLTELCFGENEAEGTCLKCVDLKFRVGSVEGFVVILVASRCCSVVG